MSDPDFDAMEEDELRAELKKRYKKDKEKIEKVVIRSDRKVSKKIDGSDKVKFLDWKNLVESTIEGHDDQALEIMLSALEGKALQEVRRHAHANRDTCDKVLDILTVKYADRRTAAQIRKQFYDIVQGCSTIIELSDQLTDCLDGTQEKLEFRADVSGTILFKRNRPYTPMGIEESYRRK